jgi:hypothetical protein
VRRFSAVGKRIVENSAANEAGNAPSERPAESCADDNVLELTAYTRNRIAKSVL